MHTITLREANQNFSKYIAAVERGEEFTVTKRGRVVARLAPVAPSLEPASVDTLRQAHQDLQARLAKYKLPHTVVKFSRDECYDA